MYTLPSPNNLLLAIYRLFTFLFEVIALNQNKHQSYWTGFGVHFDLAISRKVTVIRSNGCNLFFTDLLCRPENRHERSDCDRSDVNHQPLYTSAAYRATFYSAHVLYIEVCFYERFYSRFCFFYYVFWNQWKRLSWNWRLSQLFFYRTLGRTRWKRKSNVMCSLEWNQMKTRAFRAQFQHVKRKERNETERYDVKVNLGPRPLVS